MKLKDKETERGRSVTNRVVEDFIVSGRWTLVRHQRSWRPPTDVYETDTCVVVRVEIAGMKEEDFHIVFSEGNLTLSGVRRDPASKLAYQQMEIRYGEFVTQVYLPWLVAEEKIEASYEDGFLSVVLPKAKQQRIDVTVEEEER